MCSLRTLPDLFMNLEDVVQVSAGSDSFMDLDEGFDEPNHAFPIHIREPELEDCDQVVPLILPNYEQQPPPQQEDIVEADDGIVPEMDFPMEEEAILLPIEYAPCPPVALGGNEEGAAAAGELSDYLPEELTVFEGLENDSVANSAVEVICCLKHLQDGF